MKKGHNTKAIKARIKLLSREQISVNRALLVEPVLMQNQQMAEMRSEITYKNDIGNGFNKDLHHSRFASVSGVKMTRRARSIIPHAEIPLIKDSGRIPRPDTSLLQF